MALAGVRRIILTGFDMQHTDGKTHWHGDHGPGLTNPPVNMLAGSARVLDSQAGALAERGVEVLNATRETALRAYKRVSMEKALA